MLPLPQVDENECIKEIILEEMKARWLSIQTKRKTLAKSNFASDVQKTVFPRNAFLGHTTFLTLLWWLMNSFALYSLFMHTFNILDVFANGLWAKLSSSVTDLNWTYMVVLSKLSFDLMVELYLQCIGALWSHFALLVSRWLFAPETRFWGHTTFWPNLDEKSVGYDP